MYKHRSTMFRIADIVLLLIMILSNPMSVLAAVWTDQADYTPGSIVTINGDNSDGAGYLPGETVHVDVTGPNGYAASCEGVAGEAGAWSCQITLWDSLLAVGPYTYTAVGLTSLVTQSGAFTDAGGSYTINFAAADPEDYIPPVPYPSAVTPIVGRGNGDTEIPSAWFTQPGGADTKVESLTPDVMALGQVVPFEIRITVTGSVAPENGVITFVAGWNIDTTSNGAFGYDPSYGVLAAFIDTGDGSFIDPEGDATVSNYSWAVVGDEIQGTFTLSGLDQGDMVVLEAWLVLDETIPAKTTGNVPSRLISATTAAGANISTGNQVVPLNQVGDFFNADVDVSVTKTDSPDPVMKGSQLTYTLVVSNAGPNIANGVIVTDTLDPNTSFVSATASDPAATCSHAAGVVTCDLGASVPGAPVTITITVLVAETAPTGGTTSTGTCTVGQAGVDLCNLVSVATISDDTNTANNSDSEPTDIPAFVAMPAINVEKSSTTTSITAAGQIVPYTFVVTNTGNVPLTGITVTDSNCDAAPALQSGDTNSDDKLDLTETWTYTCSHTVTQAEIDSNGGGDGDLDNTVTAASNESQPDTDDHSISVTYSPALTVEKSSTTTSLSAPATVTYSYLVTNIGNVALTGITLSDNNDNDDMNCPAATLAVGANMTCTATHTFTQAELDAGGTLDNIVTADSDQTEPVTDSLSIPITKNAAIIVVKASTTVEIVEAGQVVPYTFTVDNEGNVTLTGITVSDANCDAVPTFVSGDANNDGKLQVDETWLYTCDHTVTQAEIDSNGDGDGDLDNTVTADSIESQPNTDDHSIPVDYNPVINVMKTSTVSEITAAAQVVPYTFVVTNTGNVTLTGVTVSDAKCDSAPAYQSGDTDTDGKLDLTETWTYTCSHTVTQAEIDAGGNLSNIVTADSEESGPDTDTLDIPITKNASLTVEKSSTTTSLSAPGTVTYDYLVTNTGNVTLTGISLSDDNDNNDMVCESDTLAVGASMTCTATHTFTQAELDAGGSLVNIVTASSNEAPDATDSLSIPITQTPAINVEKSSTTTSITVEGQLVPYTFVVTNTGNVTLTGVIVSDPKCDAAPAYQSGDANDDDKLDLSETWTYTCSHTVTQAEVDAGGNLSNTVTVTSNESEPDTDTLDIPVTQTTAIIVVKASTTVEIVEAGQVVPYNFTVDNDGNVTLTGITVTDPMCDMAPVRVSGDTNGDNKLQVNETWIYTCDHTVTQAEVDAGGDLVNTVTADSNESLPDDDTLEIPVTQSPALTLVKSATPSTYDSVGDVISYSYLVTNSGNVTLFDITVTDDKATVTCSNTTAGLAPDEQITCEASYPITQADLDAGFVTNTAYATDGTTQSEPDSETVTAAASPALTLEKSADPATYDSVGDAISYSYALTNSGNVTLSGPFTVTDDKATVTCPATPTTLAPTQSITCTASYTITQADLDSGSVTNIAMGQAYFGTTPIDSNEDSETVTAVQSPALTLVKTATPATYNSVGDSISYSYLVTNSGNVTLYNITVVDDKAAVSCPDTLYGLAPLAQITCTASYTITQADLNAGAVINTAYATDGTTQSPPDSETVSAVQSPALSLDKKVTSTGPYDSVGDVITYELVATNTGNVTLTGVTISDPLLGTLNCPQPVDLAPGATLTCTGSYTVQQSDLNAGKVDNTATATGTFGGTDYTDTDSESVPMTQSPALELIKTGTFADGDADGYADAGETITYTFSITNTGNVKLTNVTVTDPKVTVVGGPTTLDVGETDTTTFTATYTVTQADVDAGSVYNLATADSDESGPDDGDNTETLPQNPLISIVKSATFEPGNNGYADAGEVISYEFLVTNEGNVTLTGITVTDTLPGLSAITCPATTLAVGASMTCTATYTVTQADIDAGSVYNLASADSTQSEPDTDDETEPLPQNPALSLEKIGSFVDGDGDSYADVGESITYTFVVTNTGNVTLTGVTVTDPKVTPITCDADSIAVGGFITCTATYIVTQADVDAGSVLNLATADSEQSPPDDDDTTTPLPQNPALTVEKSADTTSLSAPGTVTYSYLVTNTGNVTLTGISLSDDNDNDDMSCTATTLVPGATMTCTATHTFTQAELDAGGSLDNTVTADSDQTEPVTDDLSIPISQNAALSLEKTGTFDAGADGFANAGELITYTFVVTNTGNVTLTGVTVTDPKVTPITCDAMTIPVGGFVTCTGMYTVTQADIDAGSVYNLAAADSEESGPDEDDNTTTLPQNPAIMVDKSADAVSVNEPGANVTFTFKITNTGNVTLTITELSDTDFTLTGDDDCAVGTVLPVGGSCSFSQTEFIAGDASDPDHTNTFTAVAVDGGGETATDSDDAVVGFDDVLPTITVNKTANPTSVPETGGNVTFTFTVTNTSTEPVTLTSLTDTIFGDLNEQGDCATGGTILAGGSYTCSITTFLSSDSLTDHTNVVTAVGTDNDGSTDTATDEETVTFTDVAPVITITKTATPTSVPETGGDVTFTFLVENSGQEDVTLTSLTDTVFGDLNGQGDCAVLQTITIGGSYSCSVVKFLSSDTLTAHTNVVTATAVDDDGTSANDDDEETVTFTDVAPVIVVTKIASPTSVPETGGNVTFTITVENTGSEPVTLTGAIDTVFGAIDVTNFDKTYLLVGETATNSFTVTMTGDPGVPHENVVTVTAEDNDGTEATDNATATVDFTDVAPTVTLAKIASPASVNEPGGSVTYTFVVTNTSLEAVTISSLSDDKFGTLAGDADCKVGTVLAAGASCEFTLIKNITGDAGFTHTNTATVVVTDNDGTTGTSSDDATVTVNDVMPSIIVDKTASKTSVLFTGESVTFTFKVTNTSVEPVTLTSLMDDKFGNLNGKGTCVLPQTLAVGGSYTCTYTVTLSSALQPNTTAMHVNTVTGTAVDNEGNTAIDDDSATVTFYWRGRTPGYWKNHAKQWPKFSIVNFAGQTVAITNSTPVTSVFNIPNALKTCTTSRGVTTCILDLNKDKKPDTLLQALSYQGGETLAGKAQILLRAAVAALLNEAYFGNTYPPYDSLAALITAVNSALATQNLQTYVTVANQLDWWNNGVH